MRAAAYAAALTFALAIGPGLAGDDALTARLETGGQEWVSRRFPIEIALSRPATPAEGRLAVVLGKTDLTDLFEPSEKGLRYRGKLKPLPTGTQEIVVFLVTPANEWKEIAKLTLKILRPGGLERIDIAPKLDVTVKGQLAEDHFPDSAGPARRTFQDFTGQATLSAELGRGANSLTAQVGLALAARREDALRFGERGAEADRADLASYGLKLTLGPGSLEWGGVSFGDNRHLISSFSSRGGKFTLALGKMIDISATAVNGTSIVGWDNASGLDTREHQVYAGKVGIELVPSKPGTLRIEGTVVDGSLLPRNGVNRGFVSDAEKSDGVGVRALASLFAGRLRLEGGFARSKFTSPSDPLLEQGEKVVAIAPTTRSATYANAALDVVKGAGPFTLGVAFRHERVDPQYRSIAVSTQADLQQDAVEMNAALGPVTTQFSYGWTEDNLADLPSILKTKTQRTGATAGVPLGTLLGGAKPGWWLPQLSYGLNETHQVGANRPLGGGFNDSQIPDQLSVNHTAGADWQAGSVRWGWKLNYSLTDNRQVGREQADAIGVSNSVNLALPVTAFLDASAEGGLERSVSKETGAVDRTKRIALTLGIKPFRNATLSGNASRTATADDAATKDGLNWGVNVEAGWRFEPPKRGTHGLTGQISLRYGWSTTRARDFVQGIDTFRRTWIVGSGLSLSLF
jgi:hypothetical protein